MSEKIREMSRNVEKRREISCCESPDLLIQAGETFCRNCGLVTGCLSIKLNNYGINPDDIIEKRLSILVSKDLSKRLNIDEKVPYNILTHFNRKYGIGVFNFSLPRSTCKGKTELCSKICYGNVYAFQYKHVKNRYKSNLPLTMRKKFIFLVVSQIHRLKIQYIRIHTIGDFYNQEYFDKWCEIARQCPDTKILAYTRNWMIDASRCPANFTVYYSIDFSTKYFNPTIPLLAITFKAPPERKLYKHLEPVEGGVVCSNRCHFCKYCWSGRSNIAFPIARGRRSYKPKEYHTPYQLSDDWTGKKSKRKEKIKKRKDTFVPIMKLLKSGLTREELVNSLGMPRTSVFDKLRELMKEGLVKTQPRLLVMNGKNIRGRPKTIFILTEKGLANAEGELL